MPEPFTRNTWDLVKNSWQDSIIVRCLWPTVRTFVYVLGILLLLRALLNLWLTTHFDVNWLVQNSWLLVTISWIVMIFYLAIPIVYIRWAFRRTLGNDENIQALPLTARERIAGLLVPYLAGVVIWSEISAFLSTFPFSNMATMTNYIDASWLLEKAARFFHEFLNTFLFVTLVDGTIMIRYLARWNGFSWKSVFHLSIPYLCHFVIPLLWQISMIFFSRGGYPGIASWRGQYDMASSDGLTAEAFRSLLAYQGLSFLYGIVPWILMLLIFYWLWRKDWPLIQQRFSPEG